MTFEDLKELAKAKIASATHAERWINANDAFVGAMINEGAKRIGRVALWTWREAEVTNVAQTSGQRNLGVVPADLGKVVVLYNLRTEQELDYLDDRQVVYSQDATGAPEAYSEWAGDLRLWPLPNRDDTYLLRYYRTLTDLIDATDEPLMPEEFHDLLSDYAAWKSILRIPPTGDRFLPDSAAAPYQSSFQQGLMSMVNSPFTLKSLEEVRWHDFDEFTAGAHGIHW